MQPQPQVLNEEYKKGYNQCLKDQKTVKKDNHPEVCEGDEMDLMRSLKKI